MKFFTQTALAFVFQAALFSAFVQAEENKKSSKDDDAQLETILVYQTSTTLAGWRQLTWPVSWFDFKACFFR